MIANWCGFVLLAFGPREAGYREVCLPWALGGNSWAFITVLPPLLTHSLIGSLLGDIQLVSIALPLDKNMTFHAVLEFYGTCMSRIP